MIGCPKVGIAGHRSVLVSPGRPGSETRAAYLWSVGVCWRVGTGRGEDWRERAWKSGAYEVAPIRYPMRQRKGYDILPRAQ